MYISLENIIVDNEILSSYFSCDLKKCRGACCTFPGEFGAPLLDDEIDLIETILPKVWEFLPERSRKIISEHGWFEGTKGDYNTKCIDKKDCVFVYYEGDIARCGIEKAFIEGKIEFRKPRSCHLFPIRVRKNGTTELYYQRIDECKPGRIDGLNKKILMQDFLKTALVRAFGEKWFETLSEYNKNNIKE